MVEQVHERRRHRVVVFAGDDDERIGCPVGGRELFQRRRRTSLRVFLVHLVQQRQRVAGRIDRGERVAALAERALEIPDGADTAAIGTHRPEDQRQIERRHVAPRLKL